MEASSQESLFTASSPERKHRKVTLDQKKAAVDFWRSAKSGKRSLSAVMNRYRYVKSVDDLKNFERSVHRGQSYREKATIISCHVFEKFLDARRKMLPVHDNDLRRWAIEKGCEVKACSFRASDTWIFRFKKDYGITSRKITKFVNARSVMNQVDIENAAMCFVHDCREEFEVGGFARNEIFNSDQSGFQKELHAGRSLDVVGSKRVLCKVQSVSATTHSYTIQPTLSADGELLSPLFVVVQEQSGHFGPKVLQEVLTYTPENIYVRASKSGKVSNELIRQWYREVYLPAVPKKNMLLLDSLNTHKNINQSFSSETNSGTRVAIIPEGATGLIQPLDVFFFRSWKAFVCMFSDKVMLFDLDVQLFRRENIIKLQSLVHLQFSAPMFKNFRKYSWIRAGYFDDAVVPFKTPVQFCFDLADYKKCSIESCSHFPFIVCAWCENELCFDHFFTSPHPCGRTANYSKL